MEFLRNLILFFVGFLPLVAIVSMVLAAVLGDRVVSPAGWSIGWNPVLWFIVTAPWLLPTVVIVPVLHFLGKGAASRFSRPVVRAFLLGASPTLFMLAVLVLWGPENFRWEFVLPVATSGVLYGALQQVPERGASGHAHSRQASEHSPSRAWRCRRDAKARVRGGG